MKVIQVNTVGNTGSTGRIAEIIGSLLTENGDESYIACARNIKPSRSNLIKISHTPTIYANVIWQRIFDTDSPFSIKSTKKFISQIKEIAPDIIHLHNTHGYYLHNETFLKFLAEYNKPIVWTLHDCWTFTGHCCYFDLINCQKWKQQCYNCPQKHDYPSSLIFDKSKENHTKKIELISAINNLTFVTPSNWLADLTKQSRLKYSDIKVIPNGIDLNVFKPSENDITSNIPKEKKIALFVANVWNEVKGVNFIPKIHKLFGNDFQMVIVGVNKKQKEFFESLGIIAIEKTENIEDLTSLYSRADVFVNPTLADNLPTVNMEAIACGTPVVAFNSGGTSETIKDNTGMIVQKENVQLLVNAAKEIANRKTELRNTCIESAKRFFDSKRNFANYIDLYRSILNKSLK